MAELILDEKNEHNERERLQEGLIARGLHQVITWWALGGALVFCALVALSIVSIVGRKLFSAPIEGDMELLMMGAAIGSAAFLPVCELEDHHIRVDALTNWLPKRARALLDALAHGLLMLGAAVITWRSSLYALETHENFEVSPLLLIPVWQPVVLMVPSFVLLALAALRRMQRSLQEAFGDAS